MLENKKEIEEIEEYEEEDINELLKKELMKKLKDNTRSIEMILEVLEVLEKQELATTKENNENRPLFVILKDMEKCKFNTISDLHSIYSRFEDIQEMKRRLKEGRNLISGEKI